MEKVAELFKNKEGCIILFFEKSLEEFMFDLDYPEDVCHRYHDGYTVIFLRASRYVIAEKINSLVAGWEKNLLLRLCSSKDCFTNFNPSQRLDL
jgi:hypothetical protein